MQHTKIDQEQRQCSQQIKEFKAEIAHLTKQRDALQQEHLPSSLLLRKLSRYVRFGSIGKLEWVNFKLKFKQEQLAELVSHSEKRMNGMAKLFTLAVATETLPQKMERMIRENPFDLEPHIRRVYQRLIIAEQSALA